MKKVAIFGSAFNPPTRGHLSVIERLAHFDEVWLLPSYAHAWGKKMAPFDLRCTWLTAFVGEITQVNVKIVDIEKSLARDHETVTTHAVLEYLSDKTNDSEFTFVLGPDNLLNFGKFYRSDDILRHWNVLCCPQTLDVRSTYVREALNKGDAIDTLVTPCVANELVGYKWE